MNKIITINRQFGSGGREVGKRLADELQIAYYDKEIISKISEETSFCKDYIEKFHESTISRQYPLTFGSSFIMPQFLPGDQIQIASEKIIKELAEEDPCVIIGRCANHILQDKDIFKVFIYSSDIDARIKRCYDKVPADSNKSPEQMKKDILRIDKQRSKYHNYYTGQDWLNLSNYNLCIDTAKVDVKKAVDLIVDAVK